MASPFEVPDDVLRAMVNLKKMNEPNWDVIKKWIQLQYVTHTNNAALGIHLTNDQIRNYQGASVFLYNFCGYIENPEEELKAREEKKPKVDEPQIKMPS
jgi:hypothetical protein